MQRAFILPSAPATPRQSADPGAGLIAALLATGAIMVLAAFFSVTGLWMVAALALGILIVVEPRIGLLAAFGVVPFEYVPFDPLTHPFNYLFAGIDTITPLHGVALTPVELLIAWTVVAWLIRGSGDGVRHWPNRHLISAALLTTALFLLAVERGIEAGGDSTIAWWEVRSMLAGLPVMLLVTGLVTERKHLYQLAAVFIVTAVYLTGESLWRYLTYIRPGDYAGQLEFAFSHENGVLMSVLLVICVAWAIWGPDKRQRLVAVAIAVFASIVLLTMRRRSGLLLAEAGLLTIGLVLLVKNWRAFMIVAPVVAVAATLYMGAFWDNPNSLGQPARAFRSVFHEETLSARDQASDDYRTREKQNVWWNIQARSSGLGFGQIYPKPLPLPDLSNLWPFWPYIPHNTILWVWLKAGVIGFLAFWYLLGTGVAQTARVVRRARQPWLLVSAVTVLSYFVMLAMFSYIDLGLTSPRLMILFGACLGMVTVLQRFLRDEEAEQDEIAMEAGAA